jgi:hypothetical protein
MGIMVIMGVGGKKIKARNSQKGSQGEKSF